MLYLSSLTMSRPSASCAKPREDKEGGGRQLRDCCNNTSFKNTSASRVVVFFLSHAIVIVILLLWARVKICWCEDKVLKQLNVFLVLASC